MLNISVEIVGPQTRDDAQDDVIFGVAQKVYHEETIKSACSSALAKFHQFFPQYLIEVDCVLRQQRFALLPSDIVGDYFQENDVMRIALRSLVEDHRAEDERLWQNGTTANTTALKRPSDAAGDHDVGGSARKKLRTSVWSNAELGTTRSQQPMISSYGGSQPYNVNAPPLSSDAGTVANSPKQPAKRGPRAKQLALQSGHGDQQVEPVGKKQRKPSATLQKKDSTSSIQVTGQPETPVSNEPKKRATKKPMTEADLAPTPVQGSAVQVAPSSTVQQSDMAENVVETPKKNKGGRPRKNPEITKESVAPATSTATSQPEIEPAVVELPAKKKVGRPPRNPAASKDTAATSTAPSQPELATTTTEAPKKNKGGRPRKNPEITKESVAPATSTATSQPEIAPAVVEPPTKKKVGRPPRNPEVPKKTPAASIVPSQPEGVTISEDLPKKNKVGRPPKNVEEPKEASTKVATDAPKDAAHDTQPSPKTKIGKPRKLVEEGEVSESPKRGPGRPKKVLGETEVSESPKRGPGRPKKVIEGEAGDAVKRGPGRPRRVPADVEATAKHDIVVNQPTIGATESAAVDAEDRISKEPTGGKPSHVTKLDEMKTAIQQKRAPEGSTSETPQAVGTGSTTKGGENEFDKTINGRKADRAKAETPVKTAQNGSQGTQESTSMLDTQVTPKSVAATDKMKSPVKVAPVKAANATKPPQDKTAPNKPAASLLGGSLSQIALRDFKDPKSGNAVSNTQKKAAPADSSSSSSDDSSDSSDSDSDDDSDDDGLPANKRAGATVNGASGSQKKPKRSAGRGFMSLMSDSLKRSII